MNITLSSLARRAMLLTAVLLLPIASSIFVHTVSAQTATWANTGAPANTWLITGNWTTTPTAGKWAGLSGDVGPSNGLATHLAIFSITGSSIDVNMGTASGSLQLAGMSFNNTAGSYVLSNSSASTGFIRLDGASINTATGALTGTAGMVFVLSDAATQNTTIQNGTGAMEIRLGTTTTSGIYVSTGRTLTISNVIGEIAAGKGITKSGAGTVILSGANTFTGSTNVTAGTLQIGSGGTTGSLAAGATMSISTGATLATNRSDNVSQSVIFAGRSVSGAGGFTKSGGGSLNFNIANTYTGTTNVNTGILLVNAALSSAQVTVASGATLGGSSSIAGDVIVNNGATLAPGNSAGTLSIGGDLVLNSTTAVNFELIGNDQTVGGGINDLVNVTGDLTLDGILNVTGTPPAFTTSGVAKLWRLFNYSGVLTDNGLSLGSLPPLTPSGGGHFWQVDTSITGQVNLIATVPEPGTFCLLGVVGLIGIVAVRRRKAKLAA